ncbi:hypothetical protein BWQ96_01745 [Gracilariopsis chorda]|uniref:Methyltransferase FkbM domain-containing protein n=1 Tax=Gracilariopsis chorda TaxID=448386 RepID=A0A2V3J295_9FLOR|nr:hypothetical protein BWQ96_01745 [Gracilariopsis chorda]|eukprot:PXF48576.1 hypothetical protein BWQ96_01745 [Gracilariopsis chorda]
MLSFIAAIFLSLVIAIAAIPLPFAALRQKRVFTTNVLDGFKKDHPQLFPPGLGSKNASRMVVLDIGANNGDSYTLRAYKEGHTVVAFEPSPMVKDLFKDVMNENRVRLTVVNGSTGVPSKAQGVTASSLKIGDRNKVYLIPAALSKKTTILNLHQSPCSDKRKCGKINRLVEDSKSKNIVKVPVYRLDDISFPVDPEKVWFMKIDVEGHELEVLQGARNFIKSAKIPYIGLEFAAHGRAGIQWGVDLLEELHKQQYSCYHLRGFGKCHDREHRSPSLKCNYPFSVNDWKQAPTFEEYAETFEISANRPKKASLSDIMCVRSKRE